MDKIEFLYPVNNTFRHSVCLDGSWFFAFDEIGRGKWENGIPRKRTVPVPAAIQDLCLDVTEKQWCGDLWYEKTIFVPKEWLGEDVFLRFDGIGRKGTVFINGIELGRHEGTYTEFILDITKHVRYGEDNRLVVCVNTVATLSDLIAGTIKELPNGRKVNIHTPLMTTVRQSYLANTDGIPMVGRDTPHGLVGSVHMYSLPQNRILSAVAKTIAISDEKAEVEYMVQVQGNCLVTATMRDQDGRVVATSVGGNAILTIENPTCWQIGMPYLYTIDFEVSRLGKQHDMYTFPIGLRQVEMENGRFLLNGSEVTLKGVRLELHQDFYSDADYIKVKRQMLQILAVGGNVIFAGGYTLSNEVLQIADETGILVVAELPVTELSSTNKNFASSVQDRYIDSLEHLVQRQYLYTSLVAWNVLTVPQILAGKDEEYISKLIEQARKLDWQHRPILLTTFQNASEIPETIPTMVDMLILNHWLYTENLEVDEVADGIYQDLINWNARYPNLPIILALGDTRNYLNYSLPMAQVGESENWLSTLLGVITPMPNVKGIYLYQANHVSPAVIKMYWEDKKL